jgi:hypothetical protein
VSTSHRSLPKHPSRSSLSLWSSTNTSRRNDECSSGDELQEKIVPVVRCRKERRREWVKPSSDAKKATSSEIGVAKEVTSKTMSTMETDATSDDELGEKLLSNMWDERRRQADLKVTPDTERKEQSVTTEAAADKEVAQIIAPSVMQVLAPQAALLVHTDHPKHTDQHTSTPPSISARVDGARSVRKTDVKKADTRGIIKKERYEGKQRHARRCMTHISPSAFYTVHTTVDVYCNDSLTTYPQLDVSREMLMHVVTSYTEPIGWCEWVRGVDTCMMGIKFDTMRRACQALRDHVGKSPGVSVNAYRDLRYMNYGTLQELKKKNEFALRFTS